jgi:glycosyltransferase involved in cell wall biosynthesis
MRIAHVISTPSDFGGAEKTVAQLVRYGHTHGWEQLVLNPFALDPDDGAAASFYSPATYEGRRCRTLPMVLPLRRWLSNRLRTFRPNVVHAHLFQASVLVATIQRPGDARLVLSHQHGPFFELTGAHLRQALDRMAGRRYDLVVGSSQSVEDYLRYRYRYPQGRVTFVHNGWDGDPLPRTDTDRSVVCVARLRPEKNHRMLIDAIASVRERVPDVRLRLVGDGEGRRGLEEYASRLQMSGCVEFVGGTSEVWPLLASARVFSLTSIYETLGIAALEAMAAGLPVVATAVGGLREVVHDGETGFLVSPGSTADLADRLTRLLTDDDLARQMGSRGRQMAERFRAERMAERYAQLYERLLRGANG